MTAPARPAGPLAANGCAVMAGWFLAMLFGFVGAVIALVVFDAPGWVVVPIFFGPAVLYIGGAVYLGVRHARRTGAEIRLPAEQAAVLPIVLPVVGGFFAVAGLAFGGCSRPGPSTRRGGSSRSCSSTPACCSRSWRGRPSGLWASG